MTGRFKSLADDVADVVRRRGVVGLLRKVFVGRTRHPFVQFVRYGFVGVVAAVVDTSTLLLLANVLHVNYVVAGTVGFVVGTIVNYGISVAWVFVPTGRPYAEIPLFVLIGAAGLVVNDLVLWVGQDGLGLELLWAKVLAIGVGFLWNFILRKILFDALHRTKEPIVEAVDAPVEDFGRF